MTCLNIVIGALNPLKAFTNCSFIAAIAQCRVDTYKKDSNKEIKWDILEYFR